MRAEQAVWAHPARSSKEAGLTAGRGPREGGRVRSERVHSSQEIRDRKKQFSDPHSKCSRARPGVTSGDSSEAVRLEPDIHTRHGGELCTHPGLCCVTRDQMAPVGWPATVCSHPCTLNTHCGHIRASCGPSTGPFVVTQFPGSRATFAVFCTPGLGARPGPGLCMVWVRGHLVGFPLAQVGNHPLRPTCDNPIRLMCL